MGFDQTVNAFLFLSAFTAYNSYFDNKSAVKEIKDKLWGVMKANWVIWPAAQILNFR